ncbi:serine/threonine protein kinase [Cryptosporidium felis]|nr:serine/threonine protein kinase [Cryptosporidium felis]
MFSKKFTLYRAIFILIYINEVLVLGTRYENICRADHEESKTELIRSKLVFECNSHQCNQSNTLHGAISKDNDAYLLLFKLSNYDKQKTLLLSIRDNKSGSLESKSKNNDGFALLIRKYSPKSWSKWDIDHLREISTINKNGKIFTCIWGQAPDFDLGEEQKMSRLHNFDMNSNVLRIEYENKPLLAGTNCLGELPDPRNVPIQSNELTIYRERSLIELSGGILGFQFKNITTFSDVKRRREHSSYPNDKIRGLIRYFKFNRGSFGEVWRGLAFTEYLTEPFGNCGTEKKVEVAQLAWRRGELINHELNSLILDVLNMIKKDFNIQRANTEQWNGIYKEYEETVLDIVMKKMSQDLDQVKLLYSVVREVFFGIILYCFPHVSRFLHIFEESIEQKTENSQNDRSYIWLVYRYEGISLGNLIFEIDENSSLVPSEFWWKKLKIIKKPGKENDLLKEILKQILIGLSYAHELGIVHRDIKPSNIFISQGNQDSANELLYVRIGDWGSAMMIEDETKKNSAFITGSIEELQEALYGKNGPSSEDETEGFQSPEVQFRSFARSEKDKNIRDLGYDIWSIGILMLQMIWGRIDVFSILIDDSEFQHIVKRVIFHVKQILAKQDLYKLKEEEIVEDIIYRLSLMRFCLLEPQETNNGNKIDVLISRSLQKAIKQSINSSLHDVVGITRNCSEEEFEDFVRKHDPAGIGLEPSEGLDILKKFLRPRRKERISVKEALKHPYFS